VILERRLKKAIAEVRFQNAERIFKGNGGSAGIGDLSPPAQQVILEMTSGF
jgi:hypothetical protein